MTFFSCSQVLSCLRDEISQRANGNRGKLYPSLLLQTNQLKPNQRKALMAEVIKTDLLPSILSALQVSIVPSLCSVRHSTLVAQPFILVIVRFFPPPFLFSRTSTGP
jgi:hypothetical protein